MQRLLQALGHNAQRYSYLTSPFVHHQVRNTTILCVRKGEQVVVVGDGMVSMGTQIVKPNVKKVRQVGENVIGGFAGTTADAISLFERLESKLEAHNGQLMRAAVELAKDWRADKFLRRLEASLVVADKQISLQITGAGDIIEPHDGVIGIGSGGTFATAAARALMPIDGLSARDISDRAMNIAADICVHTNHEFTFLQLDVSNSGQQVDTSNGSGASSAAGSTCSIPVQNTSNENKDVDSSKEDAGSNGSQSRGETGEAA